MARRRVLSSSQKIESIDPKLALSCDVVFANKSTEELVIAREWDEKTFPISDWIPIGIVVIPGEHGVLNYGNGLNSQCGVMSLACMSVKHPQTGTFDKDVVKFGGNNVDISYMSDNLHRYDSLVGVGLLNYKYVAKDSAETNKATNISSTYFAMMPVQKNVGEKPEWSSAAWQNGYAPSPYAGSDLMSGEFNQYYIEYPSYNCLADFRGIVNTKIITDLATSEDWKTLDVISNSEADGYYPAACCCARFKTVGTKSFIECNTDELYIGTGFWYMPACGELGYICPKLADINDTIKALNEIYNLKIQDVFITDSLISSTEYDSTGIRGINSSGGIGLFYKKEVSYGATRAFMRL